MRYSYWGMLHVCMLHVLVGMLYGVWLDDVCAEFVYCVFYTVCCMLHAECCVLWGGCNMLYEVCWMLEFVCCMV